MTLPDRHPSAPDAEPRTPDAAPAAEELVGAHVGIWSELALREGALLAILLLLGTGPAALLPARFDAATRVALAPILGFSLGTCVTTTALWFVPASSSSWLLVPLALASVAFAARRTLRSPTRGRPTLRDAAQLAVVCLAVAGPLSFVLHERHTIGPASYYFTDVDNYVAEQQAAQSTSLHDAGRAWDLAERSGDRFADLTQYNWSFLADFSANLDATALNANVNALLGTAVVDNWDPFLVVLLLAGALAAFAAVRIIVGRPTWTASLAGALFGGPLFLELWFDTHQAAIVALGLLAPVVLLGAEALSDPRRANLVLLALVLACFLVTYPLFVPPLVALGLAAVAWRAVSERRAGRSAPAAIRAVIGPALVVAALTAVFNPVAVVRVVVYYSRFFTEDFPYPRVAYKLPPEVLPGWLLQTREFWFLTPFGGVKAIGLGLLIPLALLVFVAVAVRRHRVALALVGLGAICAVAAYGAYAGADRCTYCGERYLLGLAPVLAVLLAVGLHEVLRRPSRVWKAVGVAGVLVALVAVGQRTRVELHRFADASFFMDTANRAALDELPADGRPVQLEGYWASVLAQSEQPLIYHLANDRAPGRVSISLGTNALNAISYLSFGDVRPPGPEFKSDYRYVLTRFPGVTTDRRLLARRGGTSLMERTGALDVTPYEGLNIELARIDGSGVPWVRGDGPIGLHVVGDSAAGVSVRLTFKTATPIAVPAQHGVRTRTRGDTVTACVRATGTAPIRDARLLLPVPGPRAVVLTEMRAVSGRCRP